MIFFSHLSAKTAIVAVFALLLSYSAFAQKTRTSGKSAGTTPSGPAVKQIDAVALKELLKPKGKPLLINFWATWCDPCREEFPDLVRIDTAYRGKIDFITISLDDLAEIKTSVPKFLGEMKAEMPAYLLKTDDESAAIGMVSKDWKGNLPLTILFHPDGEVGYLRSGKIKYETLAAEIDEALAPRSTPSTN